MREKIKEYIMELEIEIDRLTDELEKRIIIVNAEDYKVIAIESRLQTLQDVKNDLKGRLEEIIQ